MSVITVTTAFNIDLEFRIAAFHKRLLAWLIDMTLIVFYVYLINRYVLGLLGVTEPYYHAIVVLIALLPAYLYHLVMELALNGQSVGKMAMGIKVIDKEGKQASLGQYLLRWIFRLVDMGITLGMGAVLSAALSNYTQRLGDLVAGTVVIDKRHRTQIADTIYLEMEDEAYKPQFPQVMKLTDRDINGIRNLLDTKGSSRDTEVYMAQVAGKIHQVLQIETTLEPRELLEQLLRDYNFLTRK
jgi:uncharacterized RDD family membrane protein YckC